jgi:diaminopimelate epimerase
MELPFSKYQALGNSFIVLDDIQASRSLNKYQRLAIDICNPANGVGADGLLVISKEKELHRVDIYNADGSWAEKSGNGIRIAGMHLLNQGLLSGRAAILLTGSGQSKISFHGGNTTRRTISASLGKPVFETEKIPVKSAERYFINQSIRCGQETLVASAVSLGNPHLILFCDDFDFNWETIGAILESDPLFPRRINVGFVAVKSENEIEVRDWERGVGSTLSSGTGAAAAVVISVFRGFTAREVSVSTLAGILHVQWTADDELIIKGPVEFICSGRFQHK